jgi:hypothetical protein
MLLMAESPKQAELMVIAKKARNKAVHHTYGRHSRTSSSSHGVMALAFMAGFEQNHER